MLRLGVCLLTYERTEYALIALRSAVALMTGYEGTLRIHIADDGSAQEHQSELLTAAYDLVGFQNATFSDSKRGGYGRNVNLAMQALHNDVDAVLMLEDDWKLTRPLDVAPVLRALEASIGVECVRLGYLSFTQGLFGRVMSAPPEWYKYLLLDPDSPEPHVFAGHPRIETVAYQKRVGPWPEGLNPGATEFAVAHNTEARRGVAWPMDLAFPTRDPLFAHIGSVRSTEVGVPLAAPVSNVG